MTERYTAEMHQAHVEAEEKRKAEEERQRLERSEKETARRAWLADGGRAGDFEREWPGLRNEARRRRVVDADREAREAQRRAGVSRI
jgi:hypothetical protein